MQVSLSALALHFGNSVSCQCSSGLQPVVHSSSQKVLLRLSNRRDSIPAPPTGTMKFLSVLWTTASTLPRRQAVVMAFASWHACSFASSLSICPMKMHPHQLERQLMAVAELIILASITGIAVAVCDSIMWVAALQIMHMLL